VLLTGETGIGKSTLAMRFAAAAALEGAAVARVQCFELEQRIPFGMIGALVTSLLDCPGVMGTAPESLAEVARIVPRVKERFPHLPAPRHTEGEAARLHFAEGTFALLDAIMEEQPIVLIVDDYPRSDEASLSVLHMLLRRAANDRLMIVLSGRPPEPGEPAQATRIRKGVSYLPLRHLDLAPLSEQESDDLLQVLLSPTAKAPGSPERRALLRTAGGNPMALELLTQDWITHGDAALAVLLPAMSADVPVSALEAIGYDRLIERMLPALTPRTRVALYLAAILGPRLNDLEYFGIVDFSAAQTMAALSELVERRILRTTERRLEFVNELIRARLYLKIPDTARVRLHHGVADRLLAAVARGTTIPGLEIAWHCIRSRRRDEALPYLMSGARGAITHGAPDEAARALSSAIGSLKGRPKAEATLLLAETYQEMAEWKAALECIDQLNEEQKTDCYIREMAEVLQIESLNQLEAHSPSEAPLVVSQLTSKARSYDDPAAQVRAALSAACLASLMRRPDLLLPVLETLQQFRLDILDGNDVGRVLLARGMAHYHVRQLESGKKEVTKAALILDSLGTTNSTYVLLQTGLGVMAIGEGRYVDGTSNLETAYKGALRLGNIQLAAQAANNIALCYYRLGQPPEHLKWSAIAWDSSRSLLPGSYSIIHAAATCAFAHISVNNAVKAKEWLGRLRDAGRRVQLPWIRQAAMLFEADICWLLGQKAPALKLIEEIQQSMAEALTIGFVGPIARWTAVSSTKSEIPASASRTLSEWYARLDELDMLDQAELLCSVAQIDARGDSEVFELHNRARRVISQLPAECAKQLRRLGLRLPD
jgi:tetratricopeptide (TPR) repeat protein